MSERKTTELQTVTYLPAPFDDVIQNIQRGVLLAHIYELIRSLQSVLWFLEVHRHGAEQQVRPLSGVLSYRVVFWICDLLFII